jgi:hypothetical protein
MEAVAQELETLLLRQRESHRDRLCPELHQWQKQEEERYGQELLLLPSLSLLLLQVVGV